jgi:hypothetical protein
MLVYRPLSTFREQILPSQKPEYETGAGASPSAPRSDQPTLTLENPEAR